MNLEFGPLTFFLFLCFVCAQCTQSRSIEKIADRCSEELSVTGAYVKGLTDESKVEK